MTKKTFYQNLKEQSLNELKIINKNILNESYIRGFLKLEENEKIKIIDDYSSVSDLFLNTREWKKYTIGSNIKTESKILKSIYCDKIQFTMPFISKKKEKSLQKFQKQMKDLKHERLQKYKKLRIDFDKIRPYPDKVKRISKLPKRLYCSSKKVMDLKNQLLLNCSWHRAHSNIVNYNKEPFSSKRSTYYGPLFGLGLRDIISQHETYLKYLKYYRINLDEKYIVFNLPPEIEKKLKGFISKEELENCTPEILYEKLKLAKKNIDCVRITFHCIKNGENKKINKNETEFNKKTNISSDSKK